MSYSNYFALIQTDQN